MLDDTIVKESILDIVSFIFDTGLLKNMFMFEYDVYVLGSLNNILITMLRNQIIPKNKIEEALSLLSASKIIFDNILEQYNNKELVN